MELLFDFIHLKIRYQRQKVLVLGAARYRTAGVGGEVQTEVEESWL